MGEKSDTKSQRQRFIEAARKVGADEDPDAFKERLKKLVKSSPKDLKSERIKKSER